MKKSITTKLLKVAACSMAAVLLCGSLAMFGCSSTPTTSFSSSNSKSSSSGSATAEASMSGIHHAEVKVEGYDPFIIELDADSAPITVTNFVGLAEEGYYDGLTFYRFDEGFCVQGGSAGNSANAVDALVPIVGEFSSNGYKNPLADNYDVGVVGMARTTVPDSATSTFFITLGPAAQVGPALNGSYAAFGTIDEEGMAIVNAIVADYIANVDSAMGVISDAEKQATIESITIID